MRSVIQNGPGNHFVKKNQTCVLLWNGEKCVRNSFSVIHNGGGGHHNGPPVSHSGIYTVFALGKYTNSSYIIEQRNLQGIHEELPYTIVTIIWRRIDIVYNNCKYALLNLILNYISFLKTNAKWYFVHIVIWTRLPRSGYWW